MKTLLCEWMISGLLHGGAAVVVCTVAVGAARRSDPVADRILTVEFRPREYKFASGPAGDAPSFGSMQEDSFSVDFSEDLPATPFEPFAVENPPAGRRSLTKETVAFVRSSATRHGRLPGWGAGGSGSGDGVAAVRVAGSAPPYPESARRRRIEGSAVVEISIDAEGRISGTRLLTSSGCNDLDTAALDAVKGWGYKPALREGIPVPSLERIRFVFRLTPAAP